MIVVDASLVIDMLLGATSEAGDTLAHRLRSGEVVCAPHLIDAEVGQTLRRFAFKRDISDILAAASVLDFLDVPIQRYPHTAILTRAFELRSNVTVYDGLYLALAEVLECPLLTGDAALESVPGCSAVVEVFATSA